MARALYSESQVKDIGEKLRAYKPLPPPEKQLNKKDAVKALMADIAVMQKNGYSLDQIADALTKEGFEVTTPTLKSYMTKAKPSRQIKSKVDNQKANIKTNEAPPELPKYERPPHVNNVRPDSEHL